MPMNQLFKIKPSKKICIKLLNAFGILDFNDTHIFTKSDLIFLNSVDKIEILRKRLLKYYIPCKARTYLYNLTIKNIITILRQIVKIYDYKIKAKEKYVKGVKFITYQLMSIKYISPPVVVLNNINHNCIILFN